MNSEYLDTLAEYSSTGSIDGGSRAGQAGAGQVIGRGTFGGTFTLSLSRTTRPAATPPA